MAGKHTDLRRSGSSLRGRCPVHGGDNPTAFKVDPDEGLWHCKTRCDRGGDVVTLYQLLEGHPDAKTAAAMLLMEFGHEPPQRSDGWFGRQRRQKPARDALEEARIGFLARRIHRWFFEPMVGAVADREERASELRRTWDDAERMARLVWNSRRNGGGEA